MGMERSDESSLCFILLRSIFRGVNYFSATPSAKLLTATNPLPTLLEL